MAINMLDQTEQSPLSSSLILPSQAEQVTSQVAENGLRKVKTAGLNTAPMARVVANWTTKTTDVRFQAFQESQS